MNDNLPEACEICALLPNLPKSMIIDENELWIVNLGAQDQTCLGRTYITLKRHASELDELSDQEEIVFRATRNKLFRAIREQFNPITFNIFCLKNDAFRDNPDTTPSSAAHVHWHVMPRYGTKPIEFAGETFRDPNPGRYLSSQEEPKVVSEKTAVKIVNAIKGSYSTE